LTARDSTLLEDLRQLLEPATMGDPMRPLRWVSKSHAKLAAALCAMGHQIAKSRPGSRHEAIIVGRRAHMAGMGWEGDLDEVRERRMP
jgi:Rhodopirellula transposase DDE domain